MEATNTKFRDWTVGRSVMLELGFSIVIDCQLEDWPAAECETWRQTWHAFWQDTWNPGAILSHLGILSDSMYGDDYSAATASARGLGLQDAEQRMVVLGRQVGVEPDPKTEGRLERFLDLGVRARIAAHESQGLDWNPALRFAEQTRNQYLMLTRVLAGGDLHSAFWRLMDDYYRVFYAPWRLTRLEAMTWLEAAIIGRLGGSRGRRLLSSDVTWLPRRHVLRTMLATPVPDSATASSVLFWVDPFKLAGAVSVQPGLIAITCNTEAGAEEETHRAAKRVSACMKALGDPTRLTILTMIRHFGVDNTAIASLLGVSRPTVSKHVKILQEAGLVETRKVGRSARHHMSSAHVLEAIGDLIKLLSMCEYIEIKSRDS